MISQLQALVADNHWDLVKKYFKERESFYRDHLAGADLANQTTSQVGEKYLVCRLVADEFKAFVGWVEQNVREAEKRERRKSAKNPRP